jgi:tetratricopeptide (TPR) repeat protein
MPDQGKKLEQTRQLIMPSLFKIGTGLIVCLIMAPLASNAAPGAAGAGPNDFDRFRHASPPSERSPAPESTSRLSAPAPVVSLVARGEAALKRKNYGEAISSFTAALQLNPPTEAALVILRLRSDAYIGQGALDKALADASQMIRLDRRNFRGYQVRGRVYRRQGKLDQAIASYNIALRLNPTFAQLYNNRGIAYSAKGQELRALQDYNEAIRLAPNFTDGYVNRSTSYLELGDYAKALADCDRALRLAPEDGDVWFNRGAIYAKMGDLRKAVAQFDEALKRRPEDAEGYEAIAAAYAELGEFEQAVKYQSRAISVTRVSSAAGRKRQDTLRLYQQHKTGTNKSKRQKSRS